MVYRPDIVNNAKMLFKKPGYNALWEQTTMSVTGSSSSVLGSLAPIMGAVLVAFLVIGVAMPVLPLHVRDGLGFGPFMVGIVAGSQFAAALVSRVWAGRTCDGRGPKRAVIAGLSGASVAGLLYLSSLRFVHQPQASVAILLVGRAVLGGAEGFIITGSTVWGLARAGQQNAGKVIAWMGTAMFAGFAAGAPIGGDLYDRYGFAAVALVTAIAPLATLLLVGGLQAVAPGQRSTVRILAVLGKIYLPGLGAALSSIGFGVIVSFVSLLYAEHGWSPIWLAFTAYAVALILARLMFGHLPDKIGGAKIAFVCIFIEAAGLAIIGLATSAAMAAIGAALTGLGYALVFPALGLEAVRRAPPESQGLAMGAYTACLDLALAVSGPALGLVASGVGLGAAFLIAAIMVLLAAGIAFRLNL